MYQHKYIIEFCELGLLVICHRYSMECASWLISRHVEMSEREREREGESLRCEEALVHLEV